MRSPWLWYYQFQQPGRNTTPPGVCHAPGEGTRGTVVLHQLHPAELDLFNLPNLLCVAASGLTREGDGGGVDSGREQWEELREC